MKVKFLAGIAPITSDARASADLYAGALGLPLDVSEEYPSTDALEGVKHLGVWPLASASQSCFGTATWPEHLPVPQATIEFELEDKSAVQAAVEELGTKGFQFIHGAKDEPWGQTVARLISPEGLLIGLSYTPWLHENSK